MSNPLPRILITDFDGTLTRRDFYQLVQARLPPNGPDYWADYRAGRLSHFEALRAIFAAFPAGEEELLRLTQAMELEPDLAASVAALRAAGWEVAVASAGCRWYIDRHLATAGVSLDVHANPGHIENGRLLMDWPSQSSFQSPQTGIDKVAVVRAAVASNRTVAFAGDGPPDLPAALLVPGSLRFARGFLAEELQARGKPFQPFDRWSEIAHLLCDPGLLEQLGVGENRPVP